MRQLLTESLLLGVIGGAAGLALPWAVWLLRASKTTVLSRLAEVHLLVGAGLLIRSNTLPTAGAGYLAFSIQGHQCSRRAAERGRPSTCSRSRCRRTTCE